MLSAHNHDAVLLGPSDDAGGVGSHDEDMVGVSAKVGGLIWLPTDKQVPTWTNASFLLLSLKSVAKSHHRTLNHQLISIFWPILRKVETH